MVAAQRIPNDTQCLLVHIQFFDILDPYLQALKLKTCNNKSSELTPQLTTQSIFFMGTFIHFS